MVIACAALLLGACAQENYESESTRDDLVQEGLSRGQANCVVREMNQRISIERLGAREGPGADERDEFSVIFEECTASPDGPAQG